MDERMNVIVVFFNSILIISGRWKGDIERVCAFEPRLRLERVPHSVGIEFGTTRSAGQRLSH